MVQRHNALQILAISLYCLLAAFPAYAGPPVSSRAAVEAGAQTEVTKDLALPYNPQELAGRTCLDGRSAADFPGDIAEYWVNLECSYCGVYEPLQIQRQNPGVCIVVRHTPSREYGESLKKALSYEALKKFSVNAANIFWDKVIPKTAQALPLPYEASLLLAFQEAAISPEAFGEALGNEAASIVNQDILAAQGRISVTPTWVLAGIRFSACDFTAAQFPLALDLAIKARAGDKETLERVVTIIVNALMNEPML